MLLLGQAEILVIMNVEILLITSGLKVLTNIITSISACPIRVNAILGIMSVPTFPNCYHSMSIIVCSCVT
jgi:hypothetical protein